MGAKQTWLAGAVSALLLGLVAAAPAAAETTWLCHPALAADPCRSDLTTTVVNADGSTSIEAARAAKRPKVDCFFVYPTVSSQIGPNADLAIEPEETSVAVSQAARFSRACRIYAPMYRQRTIPQLLINIAAPGLEAPSVHETAYAGVLEAWREYLGELNRGRGVVLIGHSQGVEMLSRLIREEIDERPRVRRLIVSALLIGGNVLVGKGADAGGDFDNLPACRARRQLGCVIGYSSFDEPPPAATIFGRSPDPAKEILCTNPAALKGGPAELRPYFPTTQSPGVFGTFNDPAPQAPTPWVTFPHLYTARCESAGGANWLQVDSPPAEADPRPRVAPRLGPTAGLHLADVNLALGNLVAVVRRQVRAYLAQTS